MPTLKVTTTPTISPTKLSSTSVSTPTTPMTKLTSTTASIPTQALVPTAILTPKPKPKSAPPTPTPVTATARAPTIEPPNEHQQQRHN